MAESRLTTEVGIERREVVNAWRILLAAIRREDPNSESEKDNDTEQEQDPACSS